MHLSPIQDLYNLGQSFLDRLLSPKPPPPHSSLSRPRIAVIGAGLTGVSAASHCVGHGFDVILFEAESEKNLGGIWSRVNNTSGLQIHSALYRFHPSVQWRDGYPDRHQIVAEITKLWKRYGLQEHTKFNQRVTSVKQNTKGRWIINGRSDDLYDGIIAAVGSCGDAKMPHLPKQDSFKGEIYHSSDLDGRTAKGKKIAIIGGGASAVEALEFVVNTGAKFTSVLARSEKWIIPRNAFIDGLLALNIFGQETRFSWIPESILRIFFYRDLDDIAPSGRGLFTETPMVNSDVLRRIREHKAEWLRGDILGCVDGGIRFNHRSKGVPKNGPGREVVVDADMIIMATGYQRPSLSFLPQQVFREPYEPPNWYLQVFPPEHLSICANNCTYVNAIGTVGNFHVGVYTRLLLVFLIDPLSRPDEYWMRRWIDMTRWIKRSAPTGAFDFFTYSELTYWFVFVILINPFRWKWAFFVLFGIGEVVPRKVVDAEKRVQDGLGVEIHSTY